MAQREDGMMKDSNQSDGNVLNQMLKKYQSSRYYHSMFRKIIKDVKKIDLGSWAPSSKLFNDTSIHQFPAAEQSPSNSIFSVS